MLTITSLETADEQIKAAIAGVIRAAAPKARVHPVWVMGIVDGDNANILRSDDDKGAENVGRIHAYTITRITGTQARQGAVPFDPKVAQSQGFRLDSGWKYRIKAVHWFEHGGTSGVSSETIFNREIARIGLALAEAPKLGFDRTVEGHDQLQIDAEAFANYGGKMRHVKDLSINVRFNNQVTPQG